MELNHAKPLLLSRHFMHRRVYQYATVKSYNFHLSRFMEKNCQDLRSGSLPGLNDNNVLIELFKAVKDPHHPGPFLMQERARKKAPFLKRLLYRRRSRFRFGKFPKTA